MHFPRFDQAGSMASGPAAATTELYPAERLRLAADATGAAGLGALLLTPGPDLRYVTGYDAQQLERLTCLAVPANGDPFLVVPRLELPAAQASPAGRFGLEMIPWDETDDPYALVAGRLGLVSSVGLADRMWAMMVLRFRAALPAARQGLASAALRGLRSRKTPAEVAALREAGAAIDRVHAAMAGWLRPGRSGLLHGQPRRPTRRIRSRTSRTWRRLTGSERPPTITVCTPPVTENSVMCLNDTR